MLFVYAATNMQQNYHWNDDAPNIKQKESPGSLYQKKMDGTMIPSKGQTFTTYQRFLRAC